MNRRELVRQAERKVRPSTDNLIWIMPTEGLIKALSGKHPDRVFPVLSYRKLRLLYDKSLRQGARFPGDIGFAPTEVKRRVRTRAKM